MQDVLGDYEISVHLTNTAKYSRFFYFTRLISNLIHVVGCLCVKPCFNVRNASEETHFVWKVTFMVLYCLHCVYGNYFHGKLLSRILVQFAHELSTTMFVLTKKDCRKKIGRTHRSPRITAYILPPSTREISFKFILLLLIVLLICSSIN